MRNVWYYSKVILYNILKASNIVVSGIVKLLTPCPKKEYDQRIYIEEQNQPQHIIIEHRHYRGDMEIHEERIRGADSSYWIKPSNKKTNWKWLK
jgi:hypothetical protein